MNNTITEEVYDGCEQSEEKSIKIEQGIFKGYICIEEIRDLRDSIIAEGNEITDIKIQYIEPDDRTLVYFLYK